MIRLSCLLLAIVSLLAAPAVAQEEKTMSFYFVNEQAYDFAAELTGDSGTVWPGGDEVYLLLSGEKKSVPVDCVEGDRICYGAWQVGNDTNAYGIGPDRDRTCTTCCFTCVGSSIETIRLGE